MDGGIPPPHHEPPPPVAGDPVEQQDEQDQQQLQHPPPPNGANLRDEDHDQDAKHDLDEFLRTEVRFAPLRSELDGLEAKRDTAKTNLRCQQQALCKAIDSQNETHCRAESYAGSVEALKHGIEAGQRECQRLEGRRREKFEELGRVRAELVAARENPRRGAGRVGGGGGAAVFVDVETLQAEFHAIAAVVGGLDDASREQKKLIEKSKKARASFQEAGAKLQTMEETLALRVENKKRAVELGDKLVGDLTEKIAEKRTVVDGEKLAERVAEQRAKQKKIQLTLRNLAGDRVWRTEDLFGSMLEDMPPHEWNWNDNAGMEAVYQNPKPAQESAPLHCFLRASACLPPDGSDGDARVPPDFVSLTSTVTGTVFGLFESLADFWLAIQKECDDQQAIGDDDAGLSDDENGDPLLDDAKINPQQRVGLRFITRHAPTIEFDPSLPKAHIVVDEAGQWPVLRIASWGQVFSWNFDEEVDAFRGVGYPPEWSWLQRWSLDVCFRRDKEQFGAAAQSKEIVHRTWLRFGDDVEGREYSMNRVT